MSFRSRRLFVILLALMGIVFAVVVTWATSQIVSQRIGLSSEPVSAGLRLLPSRRHAAEPTTTLSTPPQSTPTTSPPATTAPATSTPTAPATTPSPVAEPEPSETKAGEGDRSKAGDD